MGVQIYFSKFTSFQIYFSHNSGLSPNKNEINYWNALNLVAKNADHYTQLTYYLVKCLGIYNLLFFVTFLQQNTT